MECNKEEAERAKCIAEKKMLNKDFVGARKIVLKAQQLFPELENVSHMLTVCEVHCSAEVKVNGEMDWYGILQVVPSSDELTIKKQYRKLALLLHPDKNKFGGAEAAFKLVGEAHRILTDRSKRIQHDMKRGASFRSISVSARQPAQKPNMTSFTMKQPGVASSFANNMSTKPNGINQPQPAPVSSNKSFWTVCSSCGTRYEYYQNIMNKTLRCQSCKKAFIAYDINAQGMPSAAPWNRTGIPQQEKHVPSTNYAEQQVNFGTGSNIRSQGNVASASQPSSRPGSEFAAGSYSNPKKDVKANSNGETTKDAKFEKVKLQQMNKKEREVKFPLENRSLKRGRKAVVESSESESSDSAAAVRNAETAGSNSRRSRRQKQNISYEEVNSDDDDFGILKSKKSKMGEDANGVNIQTNGAAAAGLGNGMHEREQCRRDKERGLNAEFSSEITPEGDSVTYPDPEFCDFEKARDESEFSADQIWAVYDSVDAMPRFYALIRQVYGPKFKLRFNWLDYEPANKPETFWYTADLPTGCGSFKLGKSEHTQERLMFSHRMPWGKGTKKNTYDIFPRKSEVWALFKNWDIEWSSCIDSSRHYEYEIVEILSDFTEGDVITVVRLIRLQGFVSLFVQASDKGSSTLLIQLKDVLQLSHKIPSYRLTGNEREGVPEGAFELDCASLPENFAEIFPSFSLESLKAGVEGLDDVGGGLHSKSADDKEEVATSTPNMSSSDLKGVVTSQTHVESNTTTQKQQMDAKEGAARYPNTDGVSHQPSAIPNWYEYPDSEFHNFEQERSRDKFEEGQIWALYSDVDKNPNYYGRISKIDLDGFNVHLTWLEAYCEREEDRHWFKEQLPVGCGSFKVIRENCVLDTTDTFSHIVQTFLTERKNHYVIHPLVGEIWAIYKNWSPKWSLSDLQNCDFDMVEILEHSTSCFEVLVLTKVNGYRTVFTATASAKKMEITVAESLNFSHKIPAFRLTEERGGKLRGCWELDPAAMPDLLLFADSS